MPRRERLPEGFLDPRKALKEATLKNWLYVEGRKERNGDSYLVIHLLPPKEAVEKSRRWVEFLEGTESLGDCYNRVRPADLAMLQELFDECRFEELFNEFSKIKGGMAYLKVPGETYSTKLIDRVLVETGRETVEFYKGQVLQNCPGPQIAVPYMKLPECF